MIRSRSILPSEVTFPVESLIGRGFVVRSSGLIVNEVG